MLWYLNFIQVWQDMQYIHRIPWNWRNSFHPVAGRLPLHKDESQKVKNVPEEQTAVSPLTEWSHFSEGVANFHQHFFCTVNFIPYSIILSDFLHHSVTVTAITQGTISKYWSYLAWNAGVSGSELQISHPLVLNLLLILWDRRLLTVLLQIRAQQVLYLWWISFSITHWAKLDSLHSQCAWSYFTGKSQ